MSPDAKLLATYKGLEDRDPDAVEDVRSSTPDVLYTLGHYAHLNGRRDVLGFIMQHCFINGSNPNDEDSLDYGKTYARLDRLKEEETFTDPFAHLEDYAKQ